MGKIQVFLDADVIISSLLSKTGASYEIINRTKVIKVISKIVKNEIEEVAKRLGLFHEPKKLYKNLKIVSVNATKEDVLKSYQEYVFDREDSHVVAGAKKSKSKFLLTHNIKHYNVNKINSDLGIKVIKPNNFFQ